MSKRDEAEGTCAESPKPPAGPGDLSEEKPAPQPTRKDEPKATPPAGPGKFPDPGDDAYVTPEDIARAKASARQYGSALFNALLDAIDEPGDLIERDREA
jgi:hypothetical protein